MVLLRPRSTKERLPRPPRPSHTCGCGGTLVRTTMGGTVAAMFLFYVWVTQDWLWNSLYGSDAILSVVSTTDTSTSLSLESTSLELSSKALLPGPNFPRWAGQSKIPVSRLVQHLQDAIQGTFPDNVQHFDQMHVIDHTYTLRTIHVLPAHRLQQSPSPDDDQDEDELAMRQRRAERSSKDLWTRTLVLLRERSEQYPHVTHMLQHHGGLVFLVNYGDTRQCLSSYPVWTLSVPTPCQYAFPFPGYALVATARTLTKQSYGTKDQAVFPEHHHSQQNFWQHQRRPPQWQEAKRQVIWRGSATGNSNLQQNARAQLCWKAQAEFPDLVDAKLVWNEAPNLHKRLASFADTAALTTIVGNRSTSFAGYRGVLDIDGNSWSSRFASLLCDNPQVVLKVQPEHVEYFYPSLRPNVHYLPVHGDLSNLRVQAERAVSDDQRDAMGDMIRQAHAWCQQRLTLPSLAKDLADILEAYASILTPDVADVSTILDTWEDHVLGSLYRPAQAVADKMSTNSHVGKKRGIWRPPRVISEEGNQ